MGSGRKKKRTEYSEPSSSSPSSSDNSDSSSMRSRRHGRSGSSRREKDKKRESRIRDRERKRKDRNRERDRKMRKKKLRREAKRKRDDYGSESDAESSRSGNSSDSEFERRKLGTIEPEVVVRELLKEFPDVGNDLKQVFSFKFCLLSFCSDNIFHLTLLWLTNHISSQVARIMDVEGDSPYDIFGLNRNLSIENIKKRYWKMSLLVHPDKCSHPQANQAFIRLNNAFKELQDPDKRKALDDKIKFKEEQEQFKVELRGMREAAKWRKSQGISMEGDDELLANMDDEVKVEPKRDEWMTSLPPERKPGMTMQSSRFSKGSKEGRGDTSVWTDTPSDRAQKAKTSYLEAYNEAAALASNEEAKKNSSESALVDKYNREKRSKPLIEKHREGARSSGKKKSKQQVGEKEEEWVGKHPWKPWDREKDLTAGRKTINFDPENMAQGLGSRFSSGSYQRNFL
ncbi:uncharacterized protein LOC111480750 [Cucurbita maxima]|uniref:Uncharacterized protein LOC111480750 n=1 Tax=Cucurbita maxima TaxID=3661 RepID=A0A6J1IUN5_CUCMA|nr:uncharacterized protein LOC111480750 [Cucurbita maxima]